MNSETKTCQNCGDKFTFGEECASAYEYFDLPSSPICYICRWKQLLSFWVFGKFRKTSSALSGRSIITTFSERVKFPIYSREEWNSDAWDTLSYGQEYDSSRSFLEQVAELQAKVPHPHQTGTTNVRCDWSDDVWECKDCYLSKSLLRCENVGYAYRVINCKNSYDLTYCFTLEKSYDCTHCFDSYNIKYSFDARNCIDSSFLYDCRNVKNSFMCWNLRNKKYHILNKPYTEEEYSEKIKELDIDSYKKVQALKKEFVELIRDEAIQRNDFNINAVDCTGNFIIDSRNCKTCYFIQESENSSFCFRSIQNKECADTVGGGWAEKTVWGANDAWMYATALTTHCMHCRYSMYIEFCEHCEYCFGCVGLRNKKYCILNEQYTKEEYEALYEKIKEDMKKRGEWGKFFPASMAYCGYNFSTAQLFLPETKEEALKAGRLWEDEEAVIHEGTSGEQIPDSIDEVPDSVTAQAIICEKTGRRFNVAPQELAFYREHKVPLPRNHFDWRTLDRLKPMVTLTPQTGKCFFCEKSITHFYPKERGLKKIACVECYQSKIG